MKLYKRIDDGRVVGTQAETNGKSNREELNVPTDKAGLIAWLNENLQSAPKAPVEFVPRVPFDPVLPVGPDADALCYSSFRSWMGIQVASSESIQELVARFELEEYEVYGAVYSGPEL